MDYNFASVEEKWQKYWLENKTFRAVIDPLRPKYYVLDMFPYPSGAGLHVGHPLGYIASDIFTRYKRLNGFNVLHPMGYDAFGLPAEQYAIQTGTHPAITTEKNIARYRSQMDKIGFSYDWDREVRTSDPDYYTWTQWTFIRLYRHWFNRKTNKTEAIPTLISIFEKEGNAGVDAACSQDWHKEIDPVLFSFPGKWDGVFTADQWKQMNEKQRQAILMNFRLAYLSYAMVNWCPDLGTVLANDEVNNGVSVRGGHAVERKRMRQWFLRITAYAQRLLDGLDNLEWPESLKEMQRNWIGRSEGAEIAFPVKGSEEKIEVFTTRPDTVFGATFMVLAPEHELLEKIVPPTHDQKVREYIHFAKNRSDRERMAEVKKVSGEFTGAYALNPFSGKEIPIWVADYVLAGYGTGAIMAVPAHDSRDYAFARHFNIPILQVVSGGDISEESYDAKEGKMMNSGFIDGMEVKEAIKAVIQKVDELGIGKGTVNFRLRDAIFSRQRYWGEPFPVYFKEDIPYVLDDSALPLVLPEIDSYQPTSTGEPPLARAKHWHTAEGYPYEMSTMPGFAGSSGYYLRYMDPRNNREYFSKEANAYWQDVDLYIGGAEHATGHLIYSRFWNKFLFDLKMVCREEPFKKLVNQGMIQGISQKAKVIYTGEGANLRGNIIPPALNIFDETMGITPVWINIPVEYTDDASGSGGLLTASGLEKAKAEYKNLESLTIAGQNDVLSICSTHGIPITPEQVATVDDQKVILKAEVEKMSKSKFNVVNPDDLVEKYGADTLRLYEMFLGPLEQSKPWDTHGIEGVSRFVRKLWKLYHTSENEFCVSDEQPTDAELKALHKAIKKVKDDIERLSFNTAVSTFMICVNELTELKCNKRTILHDLIILISPFAPHLAEEIWSLLGNTQSVSFAAFPELNEAYLVENSVSYPVSFNGKMRFKLDLPVDMTVPDIEKAVIAAPESQKWLEGKAPRKIIVVPGKIINVVI